MRYARILATVATMPLAMHEAKARAVMEFLAFAASGGKRSPEEVAAIVGRDAATAGDKGDVVFSSKKAAANDDKPGASIAVVGLKGVISPRLSDEMDVSGPGGTSAEGFTRRLKAAIDDPRVGGIIIDGDSPGGSAYGLTEAHAAIMSARGSKPIVAVANPFIASAAYWIVSAADEIVVAPSAEIGSVGVFTYHEDLSAALATMGVTPTLTKADMSPHKAEWHPAFELSEEAKLNMKASVNRYGEMFAADIAKGRGMKVEDVVARFGGGRMLGAADAVAAGMADRIGTLDDEIARMAGSLDRGGRIGKRSAVAEARMRLALA